jgi:hypothetical protein
MYVPTPQQCRNMERLMAEDGLTALSQPQRSVIGRTALLVDSVNLYKSAKSVFGNRARPDYRKIREIAATYGRITSCEYFVNPGCANPGRWLYEAGYRVVRTTAPDLDETMLDHAVEAISQGATAIVLATGDHRFAKIGKICARLEVACVSIAVLGTQSRALVAATQFHPAPIYRVAA